MIELSRLLVRQLRTVIRRTLGVTKSAEANTFVHFHASSTGLTIRAVGQDAAVSYTQPGDFEPQSLAVTMEALAKCEDRYATPVQFDQASANTVLISWHEAAIPRMHEHTVGKVPAEKFPELPEALVACDPGLFSALREAVDTTDENASRYALGQICLRGSAGQIVATDGKQLLVQSGFAFPWQEGVLVPALDIFGCKELLTDQPIQVGKTDTHVVLQTGPWTLFLAINKEGKYPRIEEILTNPATATSRLQIGDADAIFLQESIPSLPGADETNHGVTLDLNGKVLVRAKAANASQGMELLLSSSRLSGDACSVAINRKYLARATRLGLRRVCLSKSGGNLQAYDDRRQYIWAVLEKQAIIPASEDCVRIESPVVASVQKRKPRCAVALATSSAVATEEIVESVKSAPTEFAATPVATTPSNSESSSPIEQAIAFRTGLRNLLNQSSALIQALKQQRKQSRIVRSTLASLKGLQGVA
jgi:hypothetical protein